MVERIERIPNFQRSNFLVSLLDQVRRGRPLSDRQLAVVEKMEGEGAARKPGLPAGTIEWARRGHFDRADLDAVLRDLRAKGEAHLYDARGVFKKTAPHLIETMKKELENDFWGLVESYAEQNADAEDVLVIQRNGRMQANAQAAADEIRKGKLQMKENGALIELTMSPAPMALMRKYQLGR
jgi:hypothetical protein